MSISGTTRRGPAARALKPACVAAGVLSLCMPLAAQWPARTAPDIPRTAAGELDMDAPTPRTTDGKPDLSGVWRAGGPGGVLNRYGFSRPAAGVSAVSGIWVVPYVGIPRTDHGEALLKERQATNGRDNPTGLCLPVGLMQLHMTALPARYVQTPAVLVIVYERNGEYRQVFTDGRRPPDNDPQPWWNGYSVGRWEGDTLVVETTHLRDGGWLDPAGNPLTDAAKITERFRRPSYGRMEIDITFDDPRAYLKPFTVRWNQRLTPDDELIEFVCAENNRFGRTVRGN